MPLAIAFLSTPALAPAEITPVPARRAAPAFSLKNQNDATVGLAQLQGKVILVNFWATWCHGCKQEIPWYMEFAEKYKDAGLVVIGVSMDEDGWKSVKPFVEEKKLNYSVVIGSEELGNRYGGVDSMPVSVLIDRAGRIADSHSGVVDKGPWEQEIRQLLQEPPPDVSKPQSKVR
jgi:cytochrome c biogenesis protein CcmG/thiol:disulfide interchange protein DsbE